MGTISSGEKGYSLAAKERLVTERIKVMRELGFEYDPSTAGSSVRFDPPNPNDRVSVGSMSFPQQR